MDINLNNYMEKIGDAYQLILSYDKGKEFAINEIYKANAIINEFGETINNASVLYYNIFLLEKELKYSMVFTSTTNKKNEVIIPLHFVKEIFSSKKTITSDVIMLLTLRNYLFEERNNFLDSFKDSFIKLSEIEAEYIFNGKLNNDNYNIIPIRLGSEDLLQNILATLPFKEYSKMKKLK